MNSKPTSSVKHSGLQLAGFLMWRFGLMLAASVGTYRALRLAFQFVDLPLLLEIGIGLMVAGAVFVALSLILERFYAIGKEGDLRRDIP